MRRSAYSSVRDVVIYVICGISVRLILTGLLSSVKIEDMGGLCSCGGRKKYPSLGASKRFSPSDMSFIFISFCKSSNGSPEELSPKDVFLFLFYFFVSFLNSIL